MGRGQAGLGRGPAGCAYRPQRPGGNGAAKLFVLAEGSATRYRHGVLGDTVEPTALLMIDPDSLAIEARLALPAPMVFEDLLPRPLSIAARPALALVRASRAAVRPCADRHRAHQPRHRRQRPRFRSVLALAQPAGRRQQPLRGADASHRGMLYRYQRRGDKLAPMPLATGVSTHRIGSRQLEGAAVIERRGGAC